MGDCAERQRFNRLNRFIRAVRIKPLEQLGLNRSNLTQQFRITIHNSQQFRPDQFAQQYIAEQHIAKQLGSNIFSQQPDVSKQHVTKQHVTKQHISKQLRSNLVPQPDVTKQSDASQQHVTKQFGPKLAEHFTEQHQSAERQRVAERHRPELSKRHKFAERRQ